MHAKADNPELKNKIRTENIFYPILFEQSKNKTRVVIGVLMEKQRLLQ
jgi:hypothetical protein